MGCYGAKFNSEGHEYQKVGARLPTSTPEDGLLRS